MKPEMIVIHHSLTKDSKTVSWDAIRQYHKKKMGWRDIGYHAGVELVGSEYVIQFGRVFDDQGAHVRGSNDASLGICCVGNFDDDPPPEEQLDLLVKLVKSLMLMFDIPVEQIFQHQDLAEHKTCPGAAFPWQEFIDQLA